MNTNYEYIQEFKAAGAAYKDIHNVMENQSDLVEIINELSPLLVIKG